MFSVDSKRRNTVIPTASTYTSSRKVFHNITNNGIDYGSIITRKNGQLIDHATWRRFPSLLTGSNTSRHEKCFPSFFIMGGKLICIISFRLTKKLTPKRLRVVSAYVNGFPTWILSFRVTFLPIHISFVFSVFISLFYHKIIILCTQHNLMITR